MVVLLGGGRRESLLLTIASSLLDSQRDVGHHAKADQPCRLSRSAALGSCGTQPSDTASRRHHGRTTGRRRSRLHRRQHRGPDQLPRVEGRQLGRALLAPEGLHAGVHHRAGPRGRAQARVRQAQREGRRPVGRRRRRSTTTWSQDIEDVTGSAAELPAPRRPRSQGRRPLRHDPPERQRHAHGALGVRGRPGQQGEADAHLPGVDRPQLRRDPPRHRLAAADRQAQGRDAGRLEAGRGRHHRHRRVRRRGQGRSSPTARTTKKPYLRIAKQPG